MCSACVGLVLCAWFAVQSLSFPKAIADRAKRMYAPCAVVSIVADTRCRVCSTSSNHREKRASASPLFTQKDVFKSGFPCEEDAVVRATGTWSKSQRSFPPGSRPAGSATRPGRLDARSAVPTGHPLGGRRRGQPTRAPRGQPRSCASSSLRGAPGPYSSSKARLLFRVLGRTGNLQTALGLCHGWFFPERAPKSSVRRHRCISTRKKRDTA